MCSSGSCFDVIFSLHQLFQATTFPKSVLTLWTVGEFIFYVIRFFVLLLIIDEAFRFHCPCGERVPYCATV